MLNACGEDMLAGSINAVRNQTLQDEVVTFGCPAREDDLLGSPVDQRCDLISCPVHSRFGLLAIDVRATTRVPDRS